MTAGAHRVLVVEDRPLDREMVCEILRTRGDSPRAAATVEEALVAIEEEEFCGFVLDQELPLNATSAKAFTAGGDRVTEAARMSDRRRTEDGAYVTPIIALTAQPLNAQFMSGLFERGISAYIEKPVEEQMELFLAKLRGLYERAGRGEHSMCAALATRRPREGAACTSAEGVRIAIDGRVTRSGRTAIEINGATRDLQDSKYVVVLRCIAAREREIAAWSSRDALGIGGNRAATTLIREAFAGLVPDGFEILEGDRRGNFRLNPSVVVTRVNWEALALHPDPSVQRVAVERRKRVHER
jgi:CheY-like chemotaxis protein